MTLMDVARVNMEQPIMVNDNGSNYTLSKERK